MLKYYTNCSTGLTIRLDLFYYSYHKTSVILLANVHSLKHRTAENNCFSNLLILTVQKRKKTYTQGNCGYTATPFL